MYTSAPCQAHLKTLRASRRRGPPTRATPIRYFRLSCQGCLWSKLHEALVSGEDPPSSQTFLRASLGALAVNLAALLTPPRRCRDMHTVLQSPSRTTPFHGRPISSDIRRRAPEDHERSARRRSWSLVRFVMSQIRQWCSSLLQIYIVAPSNARNTVARYQIL